LPDYITKAELKDTLKEAFREVVPELKAEIVAELKAELVPTLKAELKAEFITELVPRIKDEIIAQIAHLVSISLREHEEHLREVFREMETRFLGAFHGFATGTHERVGSLETSYAADVNSLKKRVGELEMQLADIQMRLIKGGI
jgi:hypothetical protein